MNSKKDSHSSILQEFYNIYADRENEINEFTWDGPSDWETWDKENRKFLFLVKEARQGAQPSVPKQKIDSKFGRNIARWKYLIKQSYKGRTERIAFPNDSAIGEYNDDIAIVEVKKLNEEKHKSNAVEILEFASRDKDLLRRQIDIINPDIVVCCSTFECYDRIYDFTYNIENKLAQEEKCSCWKLDNRLVFDFYHPSTWQSWVDPNANDLKYFTILDILLLNEKVQVHL